MAYVASTVLYIWQSDVQIKKSGSLNSYTADNKDLRSCIAVTFVKSEKPIAAPNIKIFSREQVRNEAAIILIKYALLHTLH